MLLQKFEQYQHISDLLDNPKTAIDGKVIRGISAKWLKTMPYLSDFTSSVRHNQQNDTVTWEYDYHVSREGVTIRISVDLRKGKQWSYSFDYEEEIAGEDTESKEFNRQNLSPGDLRQLLQDTRKYLKGRVDFFKKEKNFSIFTTIKGK